MIKVLSIDASTTASGYAVFKVLADGSFQKIAGGVIQPEKLASYKALAKPVKTPKGVKVTKTELKRKQADARQLRMAFRVRYMISELLKICYQHKIKIVVMEDTYSGKDPGAYKWLCRLHGAMIGYCEHNDGDVTFFSPSHWRKVVGIPMMDGKKHLEREELKKLSVKFYTEKFDDVAPEDEAEATLLGLAFICEKDIK